MLLLLLLIAKSVLKIVNTIFGIDLYAYACTRTQANIAVKKSLWLALKTLLTMLMVCCVVLVNKRLSGGEEEVGIWRAYK